MTDECDGRSTGAAGLNSDIEGKDRIFHGWWMVAWGMVILIVSSGIGFYAHGVLLDPLCELHGWSKGVVSSAITLYFLSSGVTGVMVGRQVDRFGPKPVLVAASALIGLGFWLLSGIDRLWQLYIVYFIMALGWSGSSLVPVNTLIANWFILRRGLAMSVTMTGLSLGGIIVVPIATYLISVIGLNATLPALGVSFWVVIIPVAVLFIKARPADLGLEPDGLPRCRRDSSRPRPVSRMADQKKIWTRRQAAGTAAFWAIVVSFLLALGGQITYLVHQMSFLSQYLGSAGAATAVSITAGASIGGRLLLGAIVDRLDKRLAAGVCFMIQGVAVLALALSQHTAVLYLSTFAFGLTMGNILVMQSLLIGECFGMYSFGTISGIAGLFIMSGAAFGPVIAGLIYDATNSYETAFIIFAIASALAAATVQFARPVPAVSGKNSFGDLD